MRNYDWNPRFRRTRRPWLALKRRMWGRRKWVALVADAHERCSTHDEEAE